MKPMEIWSADWCFRYKNTEKQTSYVLRDIVTLKLPTKFIVRDKRTMQRTAREFGQHSENIKKLLVCNDDGIPVPYLIIFRKYINDSNTEYEIVKGQLQMKHAQIDSPIKSEPVTVTEKQVITLKNGEEFDVSEEF